MGPSTDRGRSSSSVVVLAFILLLAFISLVLLVVLVPLFGSGVSRSVADGVAIGVADGDGVAIGVGDGDGVGSMVTTGDSVGAAAGASSWGVAPSGPRSDKVPPATKAPPTPTTMITLRNSAAAEARADVATGEAGSKASRHAAANAAPCGP